MGKIIDLVFHHNTQKEHTIESESYKIRIKRDINKLTDLAINLEININKSKLFKNKKHIKNKIVKNGKSLIEDTKDLGICLENIAEIIFNKEEEKKHIKKSVKDNLDKTYKYALGMLVLIKQIISDLNSILASKLIKDAEKIKKNILSNLVIIPEMIESSYFIEEQEWYNKFISKFNDELNILEETTNHEKDLVERMAA